MPDIVYVVLKNADFTEGRGPMLLHSIWTDGEQAIQWVSKQPGIMGSPQEVMRSKSPHARTYADANGYQIKEMPLVANVSAYEGITVLAERKAALQKLTPRERELLGLG